MEPTSEQELKQLLEEGKISEDEYRQLREAMKPKQRNDSQASPPQIPRKHIFGAAVLFTIFMLFYIGLFIWDIHLDNEMIHSNLGDSRVTPSRPFAKGALLATAIVSGYSALSFWLGLWKFNDSVFMGKWTPKENRLQAFAIAFMLTGVVLPAILYFAAQYTPLRTLLFQQTAFYMAIVLELNALVFGLFSWKKRLGKMAAITAGILLVILVSFVVA